MLRTISIGSIIVRLLLAILVGGILGLERGRKNRPAGFRTYMLVCIGATMVMMTNQYVFEVFGVSDPVRMGAQVVSGIGFLGAGTILVRNSTQVRGITTAAGLWTAACSGLAIGIGFYEGAIIGSICILLVMTVLQRLDTYIHSHSLVMDVYLEYEGRLAFSNFLEYAREHQLYLSEIQITKGHMERGDMLNVVLSVKSSVKRTHAEMVDLLSAAQGVTYVEEL